MTSETEHGFLERLTLHCNAQQIPLPPLEYEDGSLLLTDALHDFIHAEGLSLRWLWGDDREYDPVETQTLAAYRKMDKDTQRRFVVALKDYVANGGNIEQVFQSHGFNPEA